MSLLVKFTSKSALIRKSAEQVYRESIDYQNRRLFFDMHGHWPDSPPLTPPANTKFSKTETPKKETEHVS